MCSATLSREDKGVALSWECLLCIKIKKWQWYNAISVWKFELFFNCHSQTIRCALDFCKCTYPTQSDPSPISFLSLHFPFLPHCQCQWHLFPSQQSGLIGQGSTIGTGDPGRRGWGSQGTFLKFSSSSFPKTFWISKHERNKQRRISFCIVIWSENQWIMLSMCKTAISRFIRACMKTFFFSSRIFVLLSTFSKVKQFMQYWMQ